MLTGIRVKNFKCFEEETLELSNLNFYRGEADFLALDQSSKMIYIGHIGKKLPTVKYH